MAQAPRKPNPKPEDMQRQVPDRRKMPEIMCDPAPIEPPTTSGSDFERDLQAKLDAGQVLTLNADMTLDAPVTVKLNTSHRTWHGIDGNLHTIKSAVRGQPAIRIIMDEGTPVGTCDRSFVLKDFSFVGSGEERSGIVMDVPYNDKWVVNPLLQNLWFEAVGGRAGLEMIGSIFEGNLYSVGTMNCIENGLYFGNSGTDGHGTGIVSAMRIFGGTQRQNGGHGILVDAYDGPYDVRCYGLYFCENAGFGAHFLAGCEEMSGCGFENNHGGAGIYFTNRIKVSHCTGSTHGPQQYLVDGYLVNPVSLIGCSVEGYGGGQPKLANFTGSGKVTVVACSGAIDSSGDIDVDYVQTASEQAMGVGAQSQKPSRR